MISWMRCCTDLRNICAHYGRLYFRIFTAMPSGFEISEAAKRRLWGAILSVKALYPSSEKWNNEFMPRIEALFEEFPFALFFNPLFDLLIFFLYLILHLVYHILHSILIQFL